LDSAAAAPAPAETPSDKLMEQWLRAAIAEYLNDGEPTWRTAALLAFAEGRRQAQSLQIPPPCAEPFATDEELMDLWRSPLWGDNPRRAVYSLGRLHERTAILRAMGVEP
jgi:hypothetical protein